jgi:hypothetical protein
VGKLGTFIRNFVANRKAASAWELNASPLKPAIKRRLGVEVKAWIDDDDLRKTRDFRKEVSDNIRSSAVFVLLASPS